MEQITDNIWTSDSSGPHKIDGTPIDAILNVAMDLANVVQWTKVYLSHCGLIDGPGNPMSAYYSAITQLYTLVKLERKILIHCHAGNSRTNAVLIMYLEMMDQRGWDYWREYVRKKRESTNRPLPDSTPDEAHRLAFDRIDWKWLRSVCNE